MLTSFRGPLAAVLAAASLLPIGLSGIVAVTAAPAMAQASDEPPEGASPSLSEPVDEAVADSGPMTMPGMTGPLSANPKPMTIDAGPLGEIYVTGAVSGLGLLQSREIPGDRDARFDLSNGQVFIQKTDGLVQFFVQAGGYSLPSLGAAYVKAEDVVGLTYGLVPQAFIKIAPSSNFNLIAGKLPTLMGAEYTFTFENMNINRGLLWNQENAVNRGVQANLALGRVSASLSLNDGYYSGKYNWLSGLVSYALTPTDTITVVVAGNVGQTARTSFATPLLQNNSQVYNLIYTHNSGPVTITPYLQYTHVPRNVELGIARSASTYGGAVLAKYSVTPEFSLVGRAEYIDSEGAPGTDRPNLLYGPGSSAWSLTFTPTYQQGAFFARADLAYVEANGVADGFGFGENLNMRSQVRGALELGFIF